MSYKEERIEKLMQEPRIMFSNVDNRVNRLYGLKMLIDDFVTEESVMVEIGSFAGISSELFSLHCKVISCVDEWVPYWEIGDSSIIAESESRFDKLLTTYGNITKIKMSSEKASTFFQDKSLDFVYIDAAHDYDNVKKDILSWLPKVKSGGVISGHDYMYSEYVKVYEVVNEIFAHNYSIKIYPDTSWAVKV